MSVPSIIASDVSAKATNAKATIISAPSNTINNLSSLTKDPVFQATTSQYGWSLLNAGNNNLPDWWSNQTMGYTQLGTPYYDSVKLYLSDGIQTEEYINTVISVTNSANVIKTNINGRKNGTVKQLVNEGDWDITIKIKIFSDFAGDELEFEYGELQQVGNAGPAIAAGQFVGQPPSTLLSGDNFKTNPKFQGDYLPTNKNFDFVEFINKFYQDATYRSIGIESIYLNTGYGITDLIPYSISSTQNPDITNMYEIVLRCYSDSGVEDTTTYTSEIIPI